MLSPVARLDVGKSDVAAVAIGGGRPLVLIAGPCVIESLDHASRICAAIQAVCAEVGIDFVFKSNTRNLALFRRHATDPGASTTDHRAFLAGLVLVLVGVLWLAVVAIGWLLSIEIPTP